MDEAPFVRGERHLQIPTLRFAAVGMTAVGVRSLGYGGLGERKFGLLPGVLFLNSAWVSGYRRLIT
jgi:hypothetical protein